MTPRGEQRIFERRIVFGELGEALPSLQLPGPVAVLGTARSLAALPPEALGGAVVHRFGGARPHNPREVVDEAGAFVDEHRCASLVAIGSSSAVDLGKAVSDGRDVLLVLIPTALGGAEMSRGYGVVDGDRKTGGRLRSPAPIVVYDPALLGSLAPRELGSIGINAWAHSIEAAYARTQHALGTAAAIEAGRTLPGLLLRAATERSAELHASLFEAAHLAGFALDARSMGLHHAVCHVIGGMTRIPHGIVNAIMLPHAIRTNARLAPEAVRAVADAFGIDDLAARSETISVAYALPRTLAQLGAPAGLSARALPLVMQNPLLRNNPAPPDERSVRELLAAAYGPAG